MPHVPQHSAFRLPVPLSRVAVRPVSPLLTPGAEFVSQLIAERQHLPPQRQRRRASLSVAVGSYDATAAQTIRRLPPGYRKSIVA